MLSREEVLKIAKLARLTLTEDEIGFYQKQLTRVLDHIQDLNQVLTNKEAFVQHVPVDAEPFREDVAVPFANHDGLMKNAPAVENNCFLLPAIMEQN
ncbi:MAG: Asp-tRNA(Asn)/Glu-tRNA(Gln) amidotransferase subunit GatC [Proteobacteria bacterium]|nr:Asp-tRNA(Asn)/Glu-tRNA(Gln) amidotransferase subunit GatC [Pseudomonadota bacterium]